MRPGPFSCRVAAVVRPALLEQRRHLDAGVIDRSEHDVTAVDDPRGRPKRGDPQLEARLLDDRRLRLSLLERLPEPSRGVCFRVAHLLNDERVRERRDYVADLAGPKPERGSDRRILAPHHGYEVVTRKRRRLGELQADVLGDLSEAFSRADAIQHGLTVDRGLIHFSLEAERRLDRDSGDVQVEHPLGRSADEFERVESLLGFEDRTHITGLSLQERPVRAFRDLPRSAHEGEVLGEVDRHDLEPNTRRSLRQRHRLAHILERIGHHEERDLALARTIERDQDMTSLNAVCTPAVLNLDDVVAERGADWLEYGVERRLEDRAVEGAHHAAGKTPRSPPS